MAYDAETSKRTITRDRVKRLRDFLRALPPELFDMIEPTSVCGSPACVCGWARVLFWGEEEGNVKHRDEVAAFLGIPPQEAADLFIMSVDGYTPRLESERSWGGGATNAQAVTVLDHYLAHGVIDWSVAK